MAKFVVTFFDRDVSGARMARFPESYYYIYNDYGQAVSGQYGMNPETIFAMLDWFAETPLGKALKIYNIGHAYTDISPSSVILNVDSEDPEMLDEMLVTLQMYAGRDIRIRRPEVFQPRPKRSERVLSPGRDRYAR